MLYTGCVVLLLMVLCYCYTGGVARTNHCTCEEDEILTSRTRTTSDYI